MPNRKIPQIPKASSSKITTKRKKLPTKETNDTSKKNSPIEEEKQTESKDKIKKEMFGVNRTWEREKLEKLELSVEKSYGYYPFNKNLPKLLIPKVIGLNHKEESIRLEIIKSFLPFSLITTNYIITMRGVVGSLRRPENDLIKEAFFGRKALGEDGCISNDILLNQTDCSISRTHCKMVFTHWFKQKKISPSFLCFLMLNQRRTNYLPKHILFNIMLFLHERKRLAMCDLGSVFGTFLRVREGNYLELKRKMSFMISPYLVIELDDVYDHLDDFLLNYENRAILRRIFLNNFEKIHVYEEFLFQVFQNFICNIDTRNLSLLFNYSHSPCLRMRLIKGSRSGVITKTDEYLIIKRKRGVASEFKINFGPTNNNNHMIDSFISFEISYDEKKRKWLMRDVSNNFQIDEASKKKSEFGLWNSLSDGKFGNLRYQPLVREVFNNDEIKVSETVFKIIC